MNPANIGNARGERAVANFDEDSITLAVTAGLETLKEMDASRVGGMYFASSTLPYKERLNAGIVSGALGLNDQVRAADFTGALKSGTTALLAALDCVKAKNAMNILVAAGDCRLGKPASPQEMIFGDAGAALLVGDEGVIAEFKDSFSVTYDFGDHFRGANSTFDDQWEDRWIRDLGIDQFIPETINGLLAKTELKIEDFSKVIYPCHYPAARKKINKKIGISAEVEQSNFQLEVGETGVAHSLLMLTAALETSKPGDKLLLVSYGSGLRRYVLRSYGKHNKAEKPGFIFQLFGEQSGFGQLQQNAGVAEHHAGGFRKAKGSGSLDEIFRHVENSKTGLRAVWRKMYKVRYRTNSGTGNLR